MKPIKLKINTKTQKYSIIIGSNLGSGVSKILKENSINFKQCLLVIDKNISQHFISRIKKSLNKKKIYNEPLIFQSLIPFFSIRVIIPHKDQS